MADTSHNIPIQTLLDLLKSNGFKDIGTTAILDIQKILATLDEEQLKDYRRLQRLLGPIVCRNKEDQEKFKQVFEQYVQVVDASKYDIDPKKPAGLSLKQILTAVFVLALAGYFLKDQIIPPPKKIPVLSLTQTNFNGPPDRKTFGLAVGDTVGFEAFLNEIDSADRKNYSIDWKLPDTSFSNRSSISAILKDTGYHVTYAFVRNSEGDTLDRDTTMNYIMCEHAPNLRIDKSQIYSYIPVDIDTSKPYKYNWYLNDSLVSHQKVFAPDFIILFPVEIRLVVDSRGINCSTDSLTASINEMEGSDIFVSATTPPQLLLCI